MLVSNPIRSLFSSRMVGDAAVGWFIMICHQFSDVLGDGVKGSEFRTVGGFGPDMVFVSMWMMPQRISTCKVSNALDPRACNDRRVSSKLPAVSSLSGRNTGLLILSRLGFIAPNRVHLRDGRPLDVKLDSAPEGVSTTIRIFER